MIILSSLLAGYLLAIIQYYILNDKEAFKKIYKIFIELIVNSIMLGILIKLTYVYSGMKISTYDLINVSYGLTLIFKFLNEISQLLVRKLIKK